MARTDSSVFRRHIIARRHNRLAWWKRQKSRGIFSGQFNEVCK
jgi:hypothetical protein